MSIAKAAILTFVNNNLKRGETNIDVQIQAVLNELSDLDLLVSTDTTKTLALGDVSMDYPTGFKCPISIVLINSSGVRQAPLRGLPGGHKQYRELRDNDSATGVPEWFSEFNKKIWPWRPVNGSFTTEIEFYKYHAQNVASIEFGDEFTNCIYFGAAYYVALKFNLSRYINQWGPLYANEKGMRSVNMPQGVYITGS